MVIESDNRLLPSDIINAIDVETFASPLTKGIVESLKTSLEVEQENHRKASQKLVASEAKVGQLELQVNGL